MHSMAESGQWKSSFCHAFCHCWGSVVWVLLWSRLSDDQNSPKWLISSCKMNIHFMISFKMQDIHHWSLWSINNGKCCIPVWSQEIQGDNCKRYQSFLEIQLTFGNFAKIRQLILLVVSEQHWHVASVMHLRIFTYCSNQSGTVCYDMYTVSKITSICNDTTNSIIYQLLANLSNVKN